jgi:hypothetical protein
MGRASLIVLSLAPISRNELNKDLNPHIVAARRGAADDGAA